MTPYFWPLLPNPVPPVLPAPITTFAQVQGVPRKVEEIKKLVPTKYETRWPSIIGGLLHAMGLEDHRVTVGDRSLFVPGDAPNGNVIYLSKQDDPDVQVQHVLPTTVSSLLSVTVTGKSIVVSLETDTLGNNATTAATLKAAIEASTSANALVSVRTFGTATGKVGVVKALTPLTYDGLAGARGDIFLRTARGNDLTLLADNFGLQKPVRLGLTDDRFRLYIAAVAFQKRPVRATLEALLTAIFGDKLAAGWAVYETKRKTITIEVTPALLAVGPSSGTFVRNKTDVATATYTGDYFRANATTTFVPRIRPAPATPVSNVFNNSVYARMRGSNRPVLLSVMKLVKAAGVKVEFVQRQG